MINRVKYSQEFKDYLIKVGKNYTTKELLKMVNEKFGYNLTLKKMQQYLFKHNIEYKYELKSKSHKGLGLPIGSERVKPDGMHLIKVANHKWEYKQRLIYEQYYGVKLPKDTYVIFLDQNRNNFDISNLKAISRHESAIMADEHLFSKDKDYTNLGVNVAKLMIKTKEINRNL